MAGYRKSEGASITWTAPNACFCTKCEKLFANERAFDKHIQHAGKRGAGSSRHLHPKKVELSLNARGMWSDSKLVRETSPEAGPSDDLPEAA